MHYFSRLLGGEGRERDYLKHNVAAAGRRRIWRDERAGWLDVCSAVSVGRGKPVLGARAGGVKGETASRTRRAAAGEHRTGEDFERSVPLTRDAVPCARVRGRERPTGTAKPPARSEREPPFSLCAGRWLAMSVARRCCANYPI